MDERSGDDDHLAGLVHARAVRHCFPVRHLHEHRARRIRRAGDVEDTGLGAAPVNVWFVPAARVGDVGPHLLDADAGHVRALFRCVGIVPDVPPLEAAGCIRVPEHFGRGRYELFQERLKGRAAVGVGRQAPVLGCRRRFPLLPTLGKHVPFPVEATGLHRIICRAASGRIHRIRERPRHSEIVVPIRSAADSTSVSQVCA